MGRHYYEATADLRKQLIALNKKRLACRELMYAFAEKHGTDTIGINESMGISFSLVFEGEKKPDAKHWKENKKQPGHFKPRLSTKEGKALDAEMHDICRQGVSGVTLGELLKLQMPGMDRGQLVWRTPGLATIGRRVLVVLPDDYKVPKQFEGQLKRISDVAFEKLTAEKKHGSRK